MQFNERLKELRLKKGISQAELAKAIFVSRSAVAKWENGLTCGGICAILICNPFYIGFTRNRLFLPHQVI